MTKKHLYLLLLVSLFLFGGGGYYNLISSTKIASNLSRYHVHNFREKNKALFKKLGLIYLKNVEVLYPETNSLDVKQTKRYLTNPAHYDQLEKQYGSFIARGQIMPLSIRYINDRIGYGVFAEDDIAAGEMVGEYTGRIMETKAVLDTKYSWVYLDDINQSGKIIKVSLDAKHAGNEMRFVNHDYNPNAVMKYIPQGGIWHCVYIASRPIKKGEQILTNYGTKYWSGSRGEPHQFVAADGKQVIA